MKTVMGCVCSISLLLTLVTVLTVAQRGGGEDCDRYRQCMEDVAAKGEACATRAKLELDRHRGKLSGCSRQFFERQLWELQLKVTRTKSHAQCLNVQQTIHWGCPFIAVPFGAPFPVIARRKRRDDPQGTPLRLLSRDELRARLEHRVNRFCTNSEEVLSALRERSASGHFKDKNQVAAFIVGLCVGGINVDPEELPSDYTAKDDHSATDVYTDDHPIVGSLIKRVGSVCSNSKALLTAFKRSASQHGVTKDEAVKFLMEGCAGALQLKAEEIPVMYECMEHDARVSECIHLAGQCSIKAQYCDICYRMSGLHDSYEENKLNMLRLDAKCRKP